MSYQHPLGCLVKAKYRIPAVSGNILPRQRLDQALNRALMYKVTLVTAPAGYGKSTAVLEWAGRSGIKAAWVSLDERDNEGSLFWQYVCASLGGVAESIPEDTQYVFASQDLLAADTHLRIILDRIGEEPSDIFLILDDFHNITNPALLEGVSFLVRYAPPHFHFILIGRMEPDMDLARLQLEGSLMRISAEDLRFTHEEIFRFCHQRGMTQAEDYLTIETYTEGWAAALVAVSMAANNGSHGTPNGTAGGSPPDLEQYLKSEVYDGLSEQVKGFLLSTSILDTFCAGLCDAVTGGCDSGRLIWQLGRGNSFLMPLDEEGNWYRYHHLFKDFLMSRLLETSPERKPELCEKAAGWYQENGDISRAVDYYIEGGLLAEALRLIESMSVHIIDTRQCAQAVTWIGKLPAAAVETSLELSALKAIYSAENGRFDQCEEWLGKLERAAASEKYAAGEKREYAEGACLMARTFCMVLGGDPQQALSVFETVTKGGFQLIDNFVDHNPHDITFYRSSMSGLLDLYGKQQEQYQRFLRHYQAMAASPAGYAALIPGEYLYEQDLPGEALDYLLKAVELADEADCMGVMVPAMAAIAKIYKIQGDEAASRATLEECEARLKEHRKTHWNYMIRALGARFDLERGDMDKVEKWLSECKLGVYSETTCSGEYGLLVFARILIDTGRMEEADLLLRRLLLFAEKRRRRHSMVEIFNLFAIAAYKSGNRDAANEAMRKSINLGMEGLYLRSFVDEGKDMALLLRGFEASGKSQRAYVRKLIEHTAGLISPGVEPLPIPAEKILTQQEQVVLGLLAEGATNAIIANTLNVSLSTVKGHISNIFMKLQVTTRVQCVNEAKERGLIK